MPAPRALVAIAAATLLAACSRSGPTPSATPSPTLPGAFISSDFTTVVPHLWRDATQDENVVAAVSVQGTVLMLLIAPPTASNVMYEHIDVSTVASPVPDDQLATYLESVSSKGASNLSSPQTFELGGTSGLYITYDYEPSGGVPHHIEDMLVNRNGSTYEIVLNTGASDFDGQLPALEQVLGAWRWTS